MVVADLNLMAIEPLPQKDWHKSAGKALRAAGMHVEQRKSELIVWQRQDQFGYQIFSEGWSVRRIWLAPRRWALGVMSKRFYFVGDSTKVDDRPEHIVISGAPPLQMQSAEKLASQRRLLLMLMDGFDSCLKPVLLQQVNSDFSAARVVCIGDSTYFSPPDKLNSIYRDHGFDMTPENFSVTVCPLESVRDEVANEFVERLTKSGAQRNVRIRVRKSSETQVVHRLRELRSTGQSAAKGRCVLFVLPSKDQMPEVGTLSLFGQLEASCVPFRRAYADDPLKFSIPDQLPSLLTAAGGVPHRSPTLVSGKSMWTVGVDLCHNAESSMSTLALTLVDPDGALVGAWTTSQPLDETARIESISKLLTHCRRQLNCFEDSPSVMVIRDGRLFENEDASLYSESLQTDVSLFEYRKRGNPQIVRTGQKPVSPNAPFAAALPDTSTMFLVTAPPRNERTLQAVTKVTWRREWNGLGLRLPQIANALTASATAPGLGLHSRHLPAAIYWADGIAGASDQDLRFRGVPVISI